MTGGGGRRRRARDEGGRGVRGLAGRLRSGWMVLSGTGAVATVSLALLVFATVFVSVAGARASQIVPTRALRASLAQISPAQRAVLGSAGFGAVSPLGGPVGDGQLLGLGRRLRLNLVRARLPLTPAVAGWSGLTTGYAVVTRGGHRAYDGSTPPQLEMVYRDALRHYAGRVNGALPVTGHRAHGDVLLQVAVTAATARRFGLTVGSRLRIEPDVTLDVTGIITPAMPGSAFWAVDPAVIAPTHEMPGRRGPPYWQGAVLVGPAELALAESSTDLSDVQLSWGYPLALHGLTVGQSDVLREELATGNLGQVSVSPPVQIAVSSGVETVLDTFAREQAAVNGVLSLLLVSLAAIGVIVVLLGTVMLAQQRRGEFTLLRARGAARWQLAALAFRSAAFAAVPAAGVAAAVAVASTPGASGSLAWWLGGLTLAAALVGLPAITALSQRAGGRGRQLDPGTSRRRAAARRLVVEVALVAVAVGGLIVARRQGVSGADADLLTSAAPVLVAIPAAVLAMRCYPLLARWLLRLAGLGRGVIAYVGLARAARTSLTFVLPAFALVLVLAMISFGTMVRAAVVRGEVAVSWQQTGADAAISSQDPALPVTQAARRALAAVAGVQRTAAVTLTSGVQLNGTQVAVAVVSPGQYGALIAGTPNPAFPAAALRQAAGRGSGGRVPVLASPAAVRAFGQASTTLAIGTSGRQVAIRVVRVAGSDPALAAGSGGGALVVLPQWALPGSPQPPNLLLVTGRRLDGQRLSAVAARVLPGATVQLRSTALAALTGAPLPHDTYIAYAVGAGAAAGFGILVLLVTLLLGAESRERTLARLAAMGLSARQASWLVLAETLPELVVVTACGTACAWALTILVGPDLNLAPFTGSGTSVQIRAEPATLAASAAGLLVVAAVTLVGQAIVAGRRGVARSVRVGE
jgi:putative ABC transport system permease protein